MSLSALCQACGFCCEGSLFRYLHVTPEEAERLREVGVDSVTRPDGVLAMRLGCTALDGAVCSIYEARPQACRAYACALGLALMDGRIAFSKALERVRRARRLIDEVERRLPPIADGEPLAAMQRAMLHGLPDAPEHLRKAERFLIRHFHGDDPDEAE